MASQCSKLYHLKDRDVIEFIVLTQKKEDKMWETFKGQERNNVRMETLEE
jgi:hypothetical protein